MILLLILLPIATFLAGFLAGYLLRGWLAVLYERKRQRLEQQRNIVADLNDRRPGSIRH